MMLALLLLLGSLGACKERPHVRSAPRMGGQLTQLVRVLLLNDATACTVKVGASFEVGVETASATGEGGERHFEDSDGVIEIALSGGTIMIGDEAIEGTEISIKPDRVDVFSLDGSDYRGTLRLVVNKDGRSFDAINHVDIESYLCGVVGAEMPDYWEPEALKAQAIAARTYCLYIKHLIHIILENSLDIY